MEQGGQHPEVWVQALSLLWSINERMGGGAGLEIEPPSWGWIDDLLTMDLRERQRALRKQLAEKGIAPDEDEEF